MPKQTKPTAAQARSILWRQGDLQWKLHAGQQVIYDRVQQLPPNARQVVFLCGRRFGKSYLTLTLALEACLKKPGSRILICAPYIKQASEIATTLMPTVTADAPKGLITRHRSTHRWHFQNGSVLMLSGLDLVAEAIRGTEFDNIYLEEDGSAAPDDFLYKVDSVLMPTLLKSRGRIFHVTTLSRIEDHPLHTVIIPKAEAQGSLFKFPTTDCPLYTKEQLDEMCEEVGGQDSIAWRREFMCQMVRDTSIVAVPEWADIYIKEFELPASYKPLISGDVGGVRDKSAFLLITYDYLRSKALVVDERVFEHHTPSTTIMADVKEMEATYSRGKTIPRFVDAPGQLQVDLAQAGFPCALPKKDSFESSLNFLRSSLPTIEIHPRCKQLIACLRFARLNNQRTDFERTAEHGHADAIMAIIYGLRAINRSNPYPQHGGADPLTHYIPTRNNSTNTSANVLKSLFT